ncbi:hypothetical protein JCM8547_007092 [Rhodosporidiobolus lusitaniae]
MAEVPPTPPAAPAPAAPAAPAAPVVPPPSSRALPQPPKPTNPFVYLGIPQFVLDWRPSRPGPKMSIFLAFTLSLTGAYVYDRRETKRIQQEYIDQVEWMSEQELPTDQRARKVRVYGARVPDDAELERSSLWFKRYMRPILVASGTDYALKVGTNPGGLGRTLIHDIRAQRITQAAQDAPGTVLLANSATANVNAVLAERDLEEQKQEKDGAIVLLGRGALKEYLWALKKGWEEPIDLREEAKLEGLGFGANERRKDGRWEREEELMGRELELEDEKNPNGSPFDEKAVPEALDSTFASLASEGADGSEPLPSQPVSFLAPAYSPFRPVNAAPPSPSNPAPPAVAEEPLILPAQPIPPQPPLTLVPFSHPFGIRTWPSKLLHFFNHRSDARLGGEYALSVILSQTRPFQVPSYRDSEGRLEGLLDDEQVSAIRRGENHLSTLEDGTLTGSKDLDFLAEKEERPQHFKKAYRTMPKGHEYYRRSYYETDLPAALKVARELARGEREPTSAEVKYPPKIESEIRAERRDKELRWRRELEGWAVVRSGSGVSWKEEWSEGDKLRVTELPSEERRQELAELKRRFEAARKARDDERDERWKAEERLKSLADSEEL